MSLRVAAVRAALSAAVVSVRASTGSPLVAGAGACGSDPATVEAYRLDWPAGQDGRPHGCGSAPITSQPQADSGVRPHRGTDDSRDARQALRSRCRPLRRRAPPGLDLRAAHAPRPHRCAPGRSRLRADGARLERPLALVSVGLLAARL